ncbi:hypothetical protein GGR56DRAFT_658250 [Xylariaceae sp. FL0804]|nr:hypothetical protein GGR56DRAFT_658250 [Xylariaceae sp. FL0804]
MPHCKSSSSWRFPATIIMLHTDFEKVSDYTKRIPSIMKIIGELGHQTDNVSLVRGGTLRGTASVWTNPTRITQAPGLDPKDRCRVLSSMYTDCLHPLPGHPGGLVDRHPRPTPGSHPPTDLSRAAPAPETLQNFPSSRLPPSQTPPRSPRWRHSRQRWASREESSAGTPATPISSVPISRTRAVSVPRDTGSRLALGGVGTLLVLSPLRSTSSVRIVSVG